jgi:2-dehydro-3-deoxyglucarate aldolase/4-hydroxy-2-oxoheptanedioate aldolase
MRDNPVKESLARGEVVLGTMVTEFVTPGIARLAAAAGAEFVLLDMEHTGYEYERMRGVIAAAEASDVVTLLRVPDSDYQFISRGLDIGAMGVMLAAVGSVEEAKAIAAAARFPPAGRRGFGLLLRRDEFEPEGLPATLAKVNESTMTLVQIENAAGLEAVEEIAAVDGVDALWIGHFDLTASLGIPGDFTNERFLAAVERVTAAGRENGKPTGIVCGSVEQGLDFLERGFRLLAYSIDILLYQDALRDGLARLAAARER